ncbi:MAG TPA: hypothetical protein VKB93_21120 [Thermoanaerobaculia bacterium]|nr:hypothetical protein [Thermoanaerobaculia bacterium]
MTLPDQLRKILEQTATLLTEADNIGLWVKSDDSSDNRNKRRLLREADWKSSEGVRALEAAGVELPGLLEDFRELMHFLEPLPDDVTDWMGANPQLDLKVRKALDMIERLGAKLPPS